MKCEYGLCLVCEKDLMVTCGSCGHKKHGNEYTEVVVPLNNGSQMPLAVCLTCKDTIWHKDKKEVMDAVKAGWHREHDKMNWSREKREDYWTHHGKIELA